MLLIFLVHFFLHLHFLSFCFLLTDHLFPFSWSLLRISNLTIYWLTFLKLDLVSVLGRIIILHYLLTGGQFSRHHQWNSSPHPYTNVWFVILKKKKPCHFLSLQMDVWISSSSTFVCVYVSVCLSLWCSPSPSLSPCGALDLSKVIHSSHLFSSYPSVICVIWRDLNI